MSTLTIENLTFNYEHHRVFDQASLSFDNPGLSVVLGKNGIGKSTLFDIISGLVKADSGQRHGFPAPKDMMYVFQDIPYTANITGAELLDMYTAMNHKNPAFSNDDSFFVDVITPLLSRKLGALSGGELTLLFVYASAAIDKALYLFDEPLASVDPENQKMIVTILDQLSAVKPVIVTSHSILPFQDTSAIFKYLTPTGTAFSGTYAELTASQDHLTDFDIFLELAHQDEPSR